jgi:site-specific recombinase XerD
MDGDEAGVFLTLQDLKTVFPFLKEEENLLSPVEQATFLKIEKKLYEYLSIEEMEDLLKVRKPIRGLGLIK